MQKEITKGDDWGRGGEKERQREKEGKKEEREGEREEGRKRERKRLHGKIREHVVEQSKPLALARIPLVPSWGRGSAAVRSTAQRGTHPSPPSCSP